MTDQAAASGPARVRLDKWLWAARLFRTRSLAKQAIESGHVRYDEARCKVSREVAIGARLRVRRGWDDIEIVVCGLDEQRRSAPEARHLYEETDASRARRERERQARAAAQDVVSAGRPTRQQRREATRFKRGR